MRGPYHRTAVHAVLSRAPEPLHSIARTLTPTRTRSSRRCIWSTSRMPIASCRQAQTQCHHHRWGVEGREDLVELPAGFQAEADGCDANEKTALIWAIEGGEFAATQLLLRVIAYIKAKDKDGRTSLHMTSKSCRLAVVQALLKACVDTEAKDKDGSTSLHWASWSWHLAVLQALLKACVDIEAKDEIRQTVLDWAERYDDEVRKEEVKAVLALAAGCFPVLQGARDRAHLIGHQPRGQRRMRTHGAAARMHQRT